LFARIGTTYGSGDNSTTFNLPDLRSKIPVGKDTGTFSTIGATGGAESVTLTSAQSGLPAHNHGITDPSHIHEVMGSVGGHSVVTNFGGGTVFGVFGFAPDTVNANSGYARAWHAINSTTGITINNNTAANAASAHTNLQPYIVMNYLIRIL
jgi:microcystin-dependent protein